MQEIINCLGSIFFTIITLGLPMLFGIGMCKNWNDFCMWLITIGVVLEFIILSRYIKGIVEE